MILNNETFNKFLKELPSVKINLELEGSEAYTELKDYEAETSSFYANISLNALESGTIDYGNHLTPPSFSSNGIVISEVIFNVFCKFTDEKVVFSTEQENQIEKDIISNIVKN